MKQKSKIRKRKFTTATQPRRNPRLRRRLNIARKVRRWETPLIGK